MERPQPEDAGQALDLAAISEVLRGNTEAFKLVVERYKNLLYKLSFSFLGNCEDAEECTQDILMRAFQYLHSFRLERRFLPWLYTIAMNHLRAVYARNRRRAAQHQAWASGAGEEPSSDPQEILEKVQSRERIRAAVSRLPRALWEPLFLHYFEQLGVATIAEILQIGEVNVKSRLLRGRRKLRRILEDGMAPPHGTRYAWKQSSELKGRADGAGEVQSPG